jgi:hypothetical protein
MGVFVKVKVEQVFGDNPDAALSRDTRVGVPAEDEAWVYAALLGCCV